MPCFERSAQREQSLTIRGGLGEAHVKEEREDSFLRMCQPECLCALGSVSSSTSSIFTTLPGTCLHLLSISEEQRRDVPHAEVPGRVLWGHAACPLRAPWGHHPEFLPLTPCTGFALPHLWQHHSVPCTYDLVLLSFLHSTQR